MKLQSSGKGSNVTEKSPFSNIHHVGAIVRDVDKAAEYYESLGIGPFEPITLNIKERILRCKVINVNDLKSKVREAQVGSIRFELIQPIEGESIWKEFLENKGEGAHHIAFVVDDIDNEEAELVKKGFKVIYRSRYSNGGTTYFETDKIGGVVFELFQRPPE